MQPQKSRFQQTLLIVVVVLFTLTLAALSYANWAAEKAASGLVQPWMFLLNILILSIPLLLLYGSIYVLLMGWHERSTLGKISPRLAKIIHCAPRIAALLIIFFIGLFSLDVFGTGAPPLEVLIGFLMHNLPSIFMLVLLMIATLGVLAWGVVGMVRGGNDPRRSNALMRYRVLFQAGAILVFGLILWMLKQS